MVETLNIGSAFDSLSTRTPEAEIFLRLLLATVFSAVIGVEREFRNKAAGLRTHILTALAAAVFTVITFELYYEFRESTDNPNADPIRVIEAVTAGVAFLAAGAIIRSEGSITGLTTGASMWMAGAIGLACGGGFYTVALMGTVLALMILTLLGKLETRYLNGEAERKSNDEQTRSGRG